MMVDSPGEDRQGHYLCSRHSHLCEAIACYHGRAGHGFFLSQHSLITIQIRNSFLLLLVAEPCLNLTR